MTRDRSREKAKSVSYDWALMRASSALVGQKKVQGDVSRAAPWHRSRGSCDGPDVDLLGERSGRVALVKLKDRLLIHLGFVVKGGTAYWSATRQMGRCAAQVAPRDADEGGRTFSTTSSVLALTCSSSGIRLERKKKRSQHRCCLSEIGRGEQARV
jgi:hypothetical protein